MSEIEDLVDWDSKYEGFESLCSFFESYFRSKIRLKCTYPKNDFLDLLAAMQAGLIDCLKGSDDPDDEMRCLVRLYHLPQLAKFLRNM